MSRVDESNMIDMLKRSCKLVDVDAAFTTNGWRIRGRQNGAVVIDVRKLYLKPAKDAFEHAYGKALQNGLIKENSSVQKPKG